MALPHVMYNVVMLPGQTAGFFGAVHNPLQVMQDPSNPDFRVGELELPGDLSPARSEHREQLLAVDRRRQFGDRRGGGDERVPRAGVSLAPQRRSSPRVRSQGRRPGDPRPLRPAQARAKPALARRLVEAGVQFVNVNDKIHNGQLANWDSHQDNFPRLKNDLLPPADQAFSALVEDLEARGLLDSTLVVALAEFGRTPRINGSGGRDHWPDCYSILLAGGGIRGGTIYGASDKFGAYPDSDPVTPGDLAATIFSAFGIDPATEVHDALGRPYRIAEGRPVRGAVWLA